jgi:phage gpG-like protein
MSKNLKNNGLSAEIESVNDIRKEIEAVIKEINGFPNRMMFYEDVSSLVFGDIEDNFTAGGRYDGSGSDILSGGSQRWTSLSKSTKAAYQMIGWSPLTPTLDRSSDGLRSAVDVTATKKGVSVVVNKPYAAIHQFGGTINHPGGTYYIIEEDEYGKPKARFIKTSKKAKYKVVYKTKPHTIEIPPRPYVVLQKDTIDNIGNLAGQYLLK